MAVTDTYLNAIATLVSGMAEEFRSRVCKDCGWSPATFYRKSKHGQLLTPAEMAAIQNIAKQMAKHLTTLAIIKVP